LLFTPPKKILFVQNILHRIDNPENGKIDFWGCLICVINIFFFHKLGNIELVYLHYAYHMTTMTSFDVTHCVIMTHYREDMTHKYATFLYVLINALTSV
jgi:hypothetical protein